MFLYSHLKFITNHYFSKTNSTAFLGPIERKRIVLIFLKWCHFILRFSYSCKTFSTKDQDLLFWWLSWPAAEWKWFQIFIFASMRVWNLAGHCDVRSYHRTILSFEFFGCSVIGCFCLPFIFAPMTECGLIPKLEYFWRKIYSLFLGIFLDFSFFYFGEFVMQNITESKNCPENGNSSLEKPFTFLRRNIGSIA